MDMDMDSCRASWDVAVGCVFCGECGPAAGGGEAKGKGGTCRGIDIKKIRLVSLPFARSLGETHVNEA